MVVPDASGKTRAHFKDSSDGCHLLMIIVLHNLYLCVIKPTHTIHNNQS